MLSPAIAQIAWCPGLKPLAYCGVLMLLAPLWFFVKAASNRFVCKIEHEHTWYRDRETHTVLHCADHFLVTENIITLIAHVCLHLLGAAELILVTSCFLISVLYLESD